MQKAKIKNFVLKRAFSITELAVVLSVILILVAGLVSAGSIIQVTRVTGAKAITSKSIVPQINGLIAWYETSANNSLLASQKSDGAQITTWYDISPSSIIEQRNSLTKTASSNTIFREDGINSIPSIEFDGNASARITLSSFYQGNSPQNTVFIVFRPMSDVMPQTLIDSHSTASTTSITISSNSVNLNAGNSASTSTSTNAPSFSYNNNYIVAAYLNGSSSQVFVNNATTSAGASTINSGTNKLTGLTVSTNKSGSSGFTGLISEIVIYNRILNLQERYDVFRYLAEKYNITVSGI